METSSFENVPEIIQCYGHRRASWPNISGTKLTGVDGTDGLFGPFASKTYSYTFNNLWTKKVTFCVELNGREFDFLQSFEIVKITTKK
jgi:hypothetical protein